jgi:hypothetical protein
VGDPSSNSRTLFDDECLRYPGFVEFDDVNGKVLTHSARAGKVYKVILPSY